MFRVAGLAAEHQQPRPASTGRRILRDQVIRELEIEFGDVHRLLL
jgi:hypothetical protein